MAINQLYSYGCKMDPATRLTTMVQTALAGEWTVQQFRSAFYDYYIGEVPDDVLNQQESDFFGTVIEKLDLTDDTPDGESRQYGWMGSDEFLTWLRAAYETLKSRVASMAPRE